MGWLRDTGSSDDGPGRAGHDDLTAIEPGVPGRCPACGGLGYIDDLDIGHGYQIQHCKECGHRWEYLFDRDGTLAGRTELDERGQPVVRTRVRTSRLVADRAPEAAPPAPGPTPAPGADPEAVEGTGEPADDGDTVIELRDPAPAPAGPPEEPAPQPHEMSAAEWLRHHALRR